jgi:hypothetical protein
MQIYEQQGGIWALQAQDGSIQTFATEQEARMAAQPTAIQEWADGAQRILDTLRAVMRDANDLSALFEDNPSIYAAILATAPGEIVPGTTYTRERLIFMGALFQDTRAYMAQPVVGNPPHGLDDPPTRRAVVMAR